MLLSLFVDFLLYDLCICHLHFYNLFKLSLILTNTIVTLRMQRYEEKGRANITLLHFLLLLDYQ
nr:MAG TPA: hypothetical protein [Caudoviricetes sp.]